MGRRDPDHDKREAYKRLGMQYPSAGGPIFGQSQPQPRSTDPGLQPRGNEPNSQPRGPAAQQPRNLEEMQAAGQTQPPFPQQQPWAPPEAAPPPQIPPRPGQQQPPAKKKSCSCCGIIGCLTLIAIIGALYFIGSDKDLQKTIEQYIPVDMSVHTKVSLKFSMPGGRGMTQSEFDEAGKVIISRLPEEWRRGVKTTNLGKGQMDVLIPGDKNPELLRRRIGEMGLLEFFHTGAQALTNGQAVPEQYRLRKCEGDYGPEDRCLLFTGTDVERVEFKQDDTGKPVMGFTLKQYAAAEFEKYTGSHIGQYMAIALNGVAVSCPGINSAVPGGAGEVSNSGLTKEQIENLSEIIRTGSLPAPVEILEIKTIKQQK